MTNDWYTSDLAHLLVAKKMTTWRHADAKLQTADCVASDEYITGRLFEPYTIAEPIGASNSNLPKFRSSRAVIGTWQEYLSFQTARNIYPFIGGCTTVEATPNTHTMAIRTSQTPIYMGRHWERENVTTAESERIDILGMLPYSMKISCSEINPVATQFNTWMCAYTKNSATDEITPTSISEAPYRWENFTFPTFTYGGATIEANIIGWEFDLINACKWINPDSTYAATTGMSYYQTGKVLNYQLLTTTLEIIPYGHNAFELIRTGLEKYATDFDLTVKCARSATDYVQWTHDKCYAKPFEISQEKTAGSYESYFLVCFQLNTGSIVPLAHDAYDDDYYENP